jgi:hypothetical protein
VQIPLGEREVGKKERRKGGTMVKRRIIESMSDDVMMVCLV